MYTVKEVIEGLPLNKANAREIPIKILKESGFTFEYLTCCVNDAFIVPVHKNNDPTDKCNYRRVGILPLLSKVFEKILFDQLYIYMNNVLNELLGSTELGPFEKAFTIVSRERFF